MDTWQTLAAVLLLASGVGARAQDAGARAPQQGQGAQWSPHREVQFVSEYIRALSVMESLRADAEQEMKTAQSHQARSSSCVHASQLQMHAMATAADLAGPYQLGGDARQTPGFLVNYYTTKGEMFRSLGNMCRSMLQGPKSGPDSGKVAAGMSKVQADMEDLDTSLPQLSVMVFGVLISPAPDRAGRMSRLLVTKRERDDLIHQISTSFKRLDAKDGSYAVSAATVLWEYLARKGYRCADEPAS